MTSALPKPFDQLRVCGVLDVLPEDGLPRPTVFSPVLLDPETEIVLVPPFEVEEGLLVRSDDEFGWETFELLCERGEATPLRGGPARSDGCLFCGPGIAEPEYIRLTIAAARLRAFADAQLQSGDAALRRGDEQTAVRAYEDAAATLQSPECYARLLLLSLSKRRRARVERALDALVGPDGREAHIEEARRQLGYRS